MAYKVGDFVNRPETAEIGFLVVQLVRGSAGWFVSGVRIYFKDGREKEGKRIKSVTVPRTW